MKKLLIIASLAVALVATAGVPVTTSFINGNTLYLTNNTTLTFLATNGTLYASSTNVFYTNRNSVLASNQLPIVPFANFSDYNGNASALTAYITGTQSAAGSGAGKVTVTLARMSDGLNPDTSAGSQFTFLYTNNATAGTLSTYSTNLPTSFTQGGVKIAPVSIIVDNTAAGSVSTKVTAFGISGFTP